MEGGEKRLGLVPWAVWGGEDCFLSVALRPSLKINVAYSIAKVENKDEAVALCCLCTIPAVLLPRWEQCRVHTPISALTLRAESLPGWQVYAPCAVQSRRIGCKMGEVERTEKQRGQGKPYGSDPRGVPWHWRLPWLAQSFALRKLQYQVP